MYKLLLLDIDGTLRDERYGIPTSAIQAITLARQHHCQVMICTGRSIGTIQDDVLALPVDGYIAGGGCYIQYHGELWYNQAFDNTLIQHVITKLTTHQVAFALESQVKIFMNHGAKQIFDAMNTLKHSSQISKQFHQEKIIYEDNFHEYDHQPIHKICLWSNVAVYRELEAILNDTFVLAQKETYETMTYYELIQKGFDKGDGVVKVQKKLNITKAETICFGDGQNDRTMFLASGVAIAMAKSHPFTRQLATSICEDIFEDGIAKELARRKIIGGSI